MSLPTASKELASVGSKIETMNNSPLNNAVPKINKSEATNLNFFIRIDVNITKHTNIRPLTNTEAWYINIEGVAKSTVKNS